MRSCGTYHENIRCCRPDLRKQERLCNHRCRSGLPDDETRVGLCESRVPARHAHCSKRNGGAISMGEIPKCSGEYAPIDCHRQVKMLLTAMLQVTLVTLPPSFC